MRRRLKIPMSLSSCVWRYYFKQSVEILISVTGNPHECHPSGMPEIDPSGSLPSVVAKGKRLAGSPQLLRSPIRPMSSRERRTQLPGASMEWATGS